MWPQRSDKKRYEVYQRRFKEHPFSEDTLQLGDALLDEISESQPGMWQEI